MHGNEVRKKADALAKKSTWPDLSDLVTLEVKAEQLLRCCDANEMPDEDLSRLLGLKNLDGMNLIRGLLETLATGDWKKGRLDFALELIYQAQEAHRAGLAPEQWLLIHTQTHTAPPRLVEHFFLGSELPWEVTQLFRMDDSKVMEAYRAEYSLWNRSPDGLRDLCQKWENRLKVSAAFNLLSVQRPRQAVPIQTSAPAFAPTLTPVPAQAAAKKKPSARLPLPADALLPVPPIIRKSGRIPLSQVRGLNPEFATA